MRKKMLAVLGTATITGAMFVTSAVPAKARGCREFGNTLAFTAQTIQFGQAIQAFAPNDVDFAIHHDQGVLCG